VFVGGLDLFRQGLRGGESFHVVPLRDFLGHLGVEVVDAHELHPGQLRINPRMFPANMPDPHHSDS